MTISYSGAPFQFTQETQARFALLDAEISEHYRKYGEVETSIAKMMANPSDQWTRSDYNEAARLRSLRLDAVRSEIAIRNTIGELYSQVEAVDRRAARSAAYSDMEQKKSEISGKLNAMGFVVNTLGIALTHPSVRDARVLEGALTSFTMRDAAAVNNHAIEKLEAKLEAAKQSATAGLN